MYRRYEGYSLCLIFLLTLCLASGSGLTGTNFSVIGNSGGRRWFFLFWGGFTGNFFYLYTEKLIELTGCRDRMLQGLLFFALMLFVTAVGIPYVPERIPGLSRLHVQISFLASLLFGISEFRFLVLLQKEGRDSFRMQWFLLAFLGFGSAVLFLSVGIVSSLLEIFLVFGICFYLWLLHHKIKAFV